MRYNFDEMIVRKGTNSFKWDGSPDPDILPMWVADMDFRVAAPITDALHRRVDHGVFGYSKVPDEYYKASIDWFEHRHGWKTEKDWYIYTTGVVPAVSAIIKALTEPGDKVIIQTPVYNCFFSSIRNNGCIAECSPLIYDNGYYTMDFEDLERRASDQRAKVMLLCNPHNPGGRVWTREELTRLGEICLRHGLTVIADEIHCELVFPGHVYTPFASISEDFLNHSVTCISPTKAFNIAGLQIANIVAADRKLRRKVDKAININEVCDVNPFGVLALVAAYNECGDWLEQMLDYVRENYEYMKDFCEKNLPGFTLSPLEGTYLIWMDCRSLGMKSEEIDRRLREEAHLWLNAGSMYGEDGEGFMRWNLACPRARVEEGLRRFLGWVDCNSR